MMDRDEVRSEDGCCTIKGPLETLLPIQLFEFKTHLLEAVEELRMVRLAKLQYEEQISKLLMEKQELAWKNESLSNQEEIIEKRHKDALSVLKKQFNAKMCAMELEKGRFQLAEKTKERENHGLREEIKVLQLSKYNLQKKVDEMEQKLQLHILAKEDHMKQLSECEKSFESVTQQMLLVNEVHEELEQNAQAANQNIEKLKAEIKQKNEEINHLKEELQKLSSDFMNYKVTHQERASKEKIGLLEKEQQLRELKERLQTEKEITKKLLEVNHTLKEEKQGDMKSLSGMVTLLQRHNETISSLENQLTALKEEYKTLERDNELQRANATENEGKFLALQSEHEKTLRMWREQNQEQQQVNINVTLNEGDQEHGSCEKNIQTNPADNAINLNSESVCKVNQKALSSESTQQPDRSSLPNVYNRIDKAHLCEEQRSDSNFTENKAKFAAAQPEELCDGEPTEQIPADRADLQDPDEDGESAPKCSSTPQTQAIMESVMLLRDNNKPLAVCSQDADQQTDCSHRKSGDGTSEVVYILTDKTDTTENKQGVLINEANAKESQLFPQLAEQLINRQSADKEDPANGDNTSCLTWDENSNSSSGQNCGMSEFSMPSCLNNENKIEPMLIAKESNDTFNVDSPLQTEEGNQTIAVEDKNKNCEDIGKPSCGTTAENKSCIGRELISGSLPSIAPDNCEEPIKNIHLQSISDHKGFQGSQSNLENTDDSEVNNLLVDRREMCPPVREDEQLGGSNTTDINFRRGCLADGHSVNICQIAKSDEAMSVEKENIHGGHNMPVNFTLEESRGQNVPEVFTNTVGSSPETQTSNSKRQEIAKSFDSSAKLCLSTTNHWESQPSSKSFSKLSNCTLTDMSSRDTYNKPEMGPSFKRLAFDNLSMNVHPVPRKDHSAEWNAIAQTFHNSPFPTEDFNKVKKQNQGSSNTATGLNTAQTKAQYDSGQGKVESSSRSSIQHHINAIEMFLQYHKLHVAKKRKLEECEETTEPKRNTTKEGFTPEALM